MHIRWRYYRRSCKKNKLPPKQKTETLSLCARADAFEILCAGAEIFLSHTKQDGCGRKSEKFVVGKNNAIMPN